MTSKNVEEVNKGFHIELIAFLLLLTHFFKSTGLQPLLLCIATANKALAVCTDGN